MRKMKDSGVKWIGSIPKNWTIQRVKHAFVRKNEKAMQDEPVVLSLARSGVKIRDISSNEGQIAESYYNYNPVEEGDLLLNPMDLYSGANCSISKVNGVISPAYINLKNKEGYNSRFYDYYFKVQYWMMAFFAHGKGVSFDNRWTLSIETLMNYPIVVLGYDEQCKRADYLDNKCKKIDDLIEKQQTAIEKLTEYKLSVITETVTKGLDSDVEYKDNGIRFIGYIPQNWNVSKLKYMSLEIGDGIHGTPEYDPEGEIYFVNGNNIGAETLVFKADTNTINETEFKKYKKPLLNDNTILMTLNGATYGKTSFYSGEEILLGKSAGYITLKPDENKEFVRYYLQSTVAKLIMDYSLCGSTIANVSLRTLNDFPIPHPPKAEQLAIVRYLDKHTSRIDKSINCRQSIVERLIEYKKSLIYEVVTGKKEV